jgi:hypothetical protein
VIGTADVLFINDGNIDYTTAEIDAIEAFVIDGGSLFLGGTYDQYGLQVDAIGDRFGLDLNNTAGSYLTDSDDSSGTYGIVHNESNFANHPIMEGISRYEASISTAFISMGSATALVTTDTDDTCTWSLGGDANGLPTMAALEHQFGRVVFSGDYVFLRPNYDTDSDGIMNLYDADNPLLVLNIFYWLSENRAPMVELTMPNGGEALVGTVSISWDAVDYDSDPITFDVYYSYGGAPPWTPLVAGHTTTTLSWDTTTVVDGDQYRVRVVASDGINDPVGDISDADFTVLNNPPTTTTTTTSTTSTTTTTTTGFPLDTTTIIIIAVAAGALLLIIAIVCMKKKE